MQGSKPPPLPEPGSLSLKPGHGVSAAGAAYTKKLVRALLIQSPKTARAPPPLPRLLKQSGPLELGLPTLPSRRHEREREQRAISVPVLRGVVGTQEDHKVVIPTGALFFPCSRPLTHTVRHTRAEDQPG